MGSRPLCLPGVRVFRKQGLLKVYIYRWTITTHRRQVTSTFGPKYRWDQINGRHADPTKQVNQERRDLWSAEYGTDLNSYPQDGVYTNHPTWTNLCHRKRKWRSDTFRVPPAPAGWCHHCWGKVITSLGTDAAEPSWTMGGTCGEGWSNWKGNDGGGIMVNHLLILLVILFLGYSSIGPPGGSKCSCSVGCVVPKKTNTHFLDARSSTHNIYTLGLQSLF